MPDVPYLADLVQITRAVLDQDSDAAEAAAARLAWTPAAAVPRPEPSLRVIAQVYERDRYTCRYCGQHVVLTAVLRLLSRRWPTHLPYHPNWAAAKTHPAVPTLSATLDHVEPVATDGDPLVLTNLVCACWTCNRRKGDLDLETLGWRLRDVPTTEWRGLADQFQPLWHALGSPPLGDGDREWMRAVLAATTQRPLADTSPGAP